METNLPGLMTVVDDWRNLEAVRNVLKYVTDGHSVLLLSGQEFIQPYAVIVPVEKYQELVGK